MNHANWSIIADKGVGGGLEVTFDASFESLAILL